MKKILFFLLFIACSSIVHAQYGWTKENSNTVFNLYDVQFLNSNKGWAVGDSASIFQCINGTWSLYRKGTPGPEIFPFLTIDCYNNNCLVSGGFSRIWKYDGSNWSTLSHTLGYNGNIYKISMTSTSTAWLTREFTDLEVYKLSGSTLTLQSVPYSTNGYLGIDFIAPNKGWISGNLGTILKYNGSNWIKQPTTFSNGFEDIFILDSLNGWAVGMYGIFKYNGTTWTEDYNNPDVYFNSVYFTDKNHGWAVGRSVYWADYGASNIYFYNGVSWTKQKLDSATTANRELKSVFFTDSLNGWAVGLNGIVLRTQTGGKVVPVLIPNPTSLGFGNVPKSQTKDLSCNLKGFNLTGNVTVIAPTGFQVKQGTGSFASSITVTKSADTVNTIIYVRFSPTTQKLFADTIKFSTPGGATIKLLVSGNSLPLITLTPTNLNFGSIKKDSSITKTFVVDAHNLADNVTITAPTAFQVKTGTGSYASSIILTKTADSVNATITVKFTPTQIKSYNDSISIQSGSVTKYLKLTASGTVSISKDPNKSLKVSCYPNPLKTGTIISYSIPEYSFINLRVYNNTGNIIKELVNKSQSEGNYEVQFDATSLPSGLYYYNLNTGLRSIWGKMVIIK
jgi:photosystem II stability/assembly factor-like uncharacterized protein